MVRQEPAKLLSPVQIWVPPFLIIFWEIKMAKVGGISRLPISNPFSVLEKPFKFKPSWFTIRSGKDKYTPSAKYLKPHGKIKK